MKKVYEIEEKDGVIHFDLDIDNYPIILGLEVYVPFVGDWIEIEADDLSINQLNYYSNQVIEHVNNWKKEKEYDSELEFY